MIDFENKDTVVITFKYPFTNMREFLLKIETLKANMRQQSAPSLLIVYFHGDAWMQSAKLWTDMGAGPLCIEDKVKDLCDGGKNVAIWAIYDCSRKYRVILDGDEAKAKRKRLNSEVIESNRESRSEPFFTLYACRKGKAIDQDQKKSFAESLINRLGETLK